MNATPPYTLWWSFMMIGTFQRKGYLCSGLWWPNFFCFLQAKLNYSQLQSFFNRILAQPPGILPLCCKWKDQLVCLFKLDFLVLQIWYIPKASKRGEDCPSQRIHPRTSLSPSIKNTIFSPYFPPNFHVLLGEREALLWLMLAIVLTSFNRPENTKYQLSRPPSIWSVGLSVVTWEMQSALLWGQLNLLLNP